jgi:dTMP kinase
MKDESKGKYIILEGPNGCGKSCNLEMLARKLYDSNVPYIQTREPSEFPIGRLIQDEYLKRDKYNNEIMVTLFAADRYEQLTDWSTKGILYNLSQGINVIQSRCFMSSMAISYSHYKEIGYDNEHVLYYVYDKNRDFHALKRPDAIIYIDTDVEELISRVSTLGNEDALERSDYLKYSKEGYDRAYDMLANNKFNMYKVDGNKSSEEVFEQIWDIVSKIIPIENEEVYKL